jgi:hypothetical protein
MKSEVRQALRTATVVEFVAVKASYLNSFQQPKIFTVESKGVPPGAPGRAPGSEPDSRAYWNW